MGFGGESGRETPPKLLLKGVYKRVLEGSGGKTPLNLF